MQMTVLSVKLPDQTDQQLIHEFRTVHAQATVDIAATLGIITRYVQGLTLRCCTDDDVSPIERPPLPESTVPLQIYAQLTWPSTTVLQGSLHSSGYKESAGKHVFATSHQVFLTEYLEVDAADTVDRAWPLNASPEAAPVLLLMVLIPTEQTSDAQFRAAWDVHADRWRKLGVVYQRNMVLPLTPEQVEAILEGSLFPPSVTVRRGGYEEFIFPSCKEAQEFVDTYSDEMQKSYAGFCGPESYFSGFDRKVPFAEGDRGFKQKVMNIVLQTVFQATTTFNISI
jgi:hypothetical protein